MQGLRDGGGWVVDVEFMRGVVDYADTGGWSRDAVVIVGRGWLVGVGVGVGVAA
jgi:hypothetical protein